MPAAWTLAWWALGAIILGAFATEAALGFGAIVISVAVGAQLVPIEQLLPVLVPLNLGLSSYLALRYARLTDRPFLFRRVLPPVAIGIPIGVFAFARLPGPLLVRIFGVFVVGLAAVEIARMIRRREAQPLAPALRAGLLFLGGAVHGAFATGGPFVVYVTGRELADKHAFRATLSTLWALLGVVLCVSYAVTGALTSATLATSVAFVVPASLGIVVGEWAHARAQAATFRGALFVMLLVAGALLVAR